MRKMTSTNPADLAWPNDSADMTEAIQVCTERGYSVTRCSLYQIKVGWVSYYPGKGTICPDEQRALPERGLGAFIAALEQLGIRPVASGASVYVKIG